MIVAAAQAAHAAILELEDSNKQEKIDHRKLPSIWPAPPLMISLSFSTVMVPLGPVFRTVPPTSTQPCEPYNVRAILICAHTMVRTAIFWRISFGVYTAFVGVLGLTFLVAICLRMARSLLQFLSMNMVVGGCVDPLNVLIFIINTGLFVTGLC